MGTPQDRREELLEELVFQVLERCESGETGVVEELCRRVIIIDHGTIFFDGQLNDVLDRFADFKLITIHCAEAAGGPRTGLDRYGEVLEQDGATVKLKVKRDRVIPACKALLDELPVADIDIQEVPIEDIIRQIFDRGRPGS